MTHPPFLQASRLQDARVQHGFFGRVGGVSEGIYASLNAGPGSKDDPLAVEENRRRIAAAMGVAHHRLVSMYQAHTANARLVERPWAGRWPETDAIVTATPGLALAVLTADCAPILMADPEAGIIGAAHAGWKGALGGIIEAALERMEEAGAARARIQAAIGPCIQAQSYEIGPEFEARFAAEDSESGAFFHTAPSGRRHFDLPRYCLHRLARAGVIAAESLGRDTYAEADALFSHRRSVHAGEPDYGRNCAVIALKP